MATSASGPGLAAGLENGSSSVSDDMASAADDCAGQATIRTCWDWTGSIAYISISID